MIEDKLFENQTITASNNPAANLLDKDHVEQDLDSYEFANDANVLYVFEGDNDADLRVTQNKDDGSGDGWLVPESSRWAVGGFRINSQGVYKWLRADSDTDVTVSAYVINGDHGIIYGRQDEKVELVSSNGLSRYVSSSDESSANIATGPAELYELNVLVPPAEGDDNANYVQIWDGDPNSGGSIIDQRGKVASSTDPTHYTFDSELGLESSNDLYIYISTDYTSATAGTVAGRIYARYSN